MSDFKIGDVVELYYVNKTSSEYAKSLKGSIGVITEHFRFNSPGKMKNEDGISFVNPMKFRISVFNSSGRHFDIMSQVARKHIRHYDMMSSQQ